jgi:LPXTG-site transpeptidase (sortase) family protein
MAYNMAMNKGFHPKETGNKPPFAVYLSVTVILFVLTLSVADSIGLVPDYIDGTQSEHMAVSDSQSNSPDGDWSEFDQSVSVSNLPELGEAVSAPTPVVEQQHSAALSKPTKILIPAIDMNLPVQNPSTRDLSALDTLLQKGPARYVDSAKLNERGNVIIFAHSSHLPVVHNQMYKAFNRVPELVKGDTITLVGDDGQKYLYSVTSVRKADANDATIDLSPLHGTKLTLVTCDTLTGKSARFILEADFIGTVDL